MAQTEQTSKPKNVSTALRNKFAMFAAGRKPRTLAKDNAGVSAVIGVILMVAVTVILAAVIAAFLFGMAPNMISSQGGSPIGYKVTEGIITITNNGGLKFVDPVIQINGYKINPAADALPADPEYVAAVLMCSKLFVQEDYATAPVNGGAAAALLDDVGGSVHIITDDADYPVNADMVITITALVDGNRVVISSYTVQ